MKFTMKGLRCSSHDITTKNKSNVHNLILIYSRGRKISNFMCFKMSFTSSVLLLGCIHGFRQTYTVFFIRFLSVLVAYNSYLLNAFLALRRYIKSVYSTLIVTVCFYPPSAPFSLPSSPSEASSICVFSFQCFV